ncbi:MAG: hypothetical protein EXR93_06085 [Gemmatimonadetes bacterium]|nr:hypothetical protein [Gemmatimonadota bacterium]
MFERLRAAINAALDAATPPPDLSELSGQMRQAVVELRSAVIKMRQDYLVTQQHITAETQALEDADRRGKLAAGINDHDTATIAEQFVAKHAERVAVLEQKLAAQTAELGLSERELAGMTEQLKRLEKERPQASSSAWRNIEAAGGTRPETDLADELVKGQIDRVAKEATAEEQLKALKKRMGKP